jgi:hypothetical protein
MSKKLKGRLENEIIPFFRHVCLGFVFSILLANCGDSPEVAPADNQSSLSDPAHPRQNWLEDALRRRWDTIAFFISDPVDSLKIEKMKKKARIYVRGWLAEYNAEIKAINPDTTQYIVDSFYFERKPGMPLRYTIKAFLRPDARHHSEHDDTTGSPGGHLIPPEPDPPGGFQ